MKKKKVKNQKMEKIGKKLLVIFIFIFPLLVFAADKIDVVAQVDRNQMGIGDPFTVIVTVQANDDVEIVEPVFPTVPGIEVLNAYAGGRQTSSNMSIINGQTSFVQTTSQSYHFQLSPQKEGTFLIPVIDVKVNGQTYKTNPIKIQVAEEFRGAAKQQRGNQKRIPGRPQFPPGFGGSDDEEDLPGGFGQIPDAEDLFNQMMQQRQRLFGQLPNQGRGFGQNQPIPSRKLDINTNEAFFIYLDLDKTEVYEGEQVTANWYIYSRGQLESIDRVKFPDLKGFWKEIIEEVPSLMFTSEIVNGVQYQKALLASHALFPIKAGVAVLDEFRIKGKVRLPTQFGWGAPHEWTKTSKRVPLKVLPLPTEGKPLSFSGAVGSYRVGLKTEGTSFPANQPFSMRLRFEGIGNAKLIDMPSIAWPDSLEVFDTKGDSKFFKDGQSYKEFEILVIPRKEGELKIPKISFSYFDPQQKKYVTTNTEELTLNITQGLAANANTSGTIAKKSTESEIYKPQVYLELPKSSFQFSEFRLPFYIGLTALVLMSVLFQFFMQLRGLRFEPELKQIIDSKIKMIEAALKHSENRKIGSESINLIYILTASLAGYKKADQEWSTLIKEIPIKAQNKFLKRLTSLFDYFQLLGFSPDEVVQNLISSKPVASQFDDLKQLAGEVSAYSKAEEEI